MIKSCDHYLGWIGRRDCLGARRGWWGFGMGGGRIIKWGFCGRICLIVCGLIGGGSGSLELVIRDLSLGKVCKGDWGWGCKW